MNHDSAESIQMGRYAEIAGEYDSLHADPEHEAGMSLLAGMLGHVRAASVLDVGAGTGRTIRFLASRCPGLLLTGIEPVKELREIGHRHGIPEDQLVEGDGYKLSFPDNSIDVVSCVGVLHHVQEPNRVVAEMFRVARRGVFISDANNFGGGGAVARFGKQALHMAGLWPLTQFVLTRGKGYWITEGDGLFYSYSIFDSMKLIKAKSSIVYQMNTRPSGPNLYRTSPTVAVFAVKSQ